MGTGPYSLESLSRDLCSLDKHSGSEPFLYVKLEMRLRKAGKNRLYFFNTCTSNVDSFSHTSYFISFCKVTWMGCIVGN